MLPTARLVMFVVLWPKKRYHSLPPRVLVDQKNRYKMVNCSGLKKTDSPMRVGVRPTRTRESQIEVLTSIFAFFHELSVGTCYQIVV